MSELRLNDLGAYSLGRADAPLTMVEFTDLQCPFCRQYATTTFEEIRKNWIETGKLRYFTKDFPLDIHPQALPAARASRCAGEQGKFWELRLALLRSGDRLTGDFIKSAGADLQLDMKAFDACTGSSKHDAGIQAELSEALAVGLSGTPTFIIGLSQGSGVEGSVLVGALPYSAFDARLKEALVAR